MNPNAKTGLLRVAQAYSRETVERYVQAPTNYREMMHLRLHEKIRTTIYESLKDGREYVIRVGKPWQRHPTDEPYPHVVTYQIEAVVLLKDPAQAEVGEFLHGDVCDPYDGRRVRVLSITRPRPYTVKLRMHQILWDGIGGRMWELVEKI